MAQIDVLESGRFPNTSTDAANGMVIAEEEKKQQISRSHYSRSVKLQPDEIGRASLQFADESEAKIQQEEEASSESNL